MVVESREAGSGGGRGVHLASNQVRYGGAGGVAAAEGEIGGYALSPDFFDLGAFFDRRGPRRMLAVPGMSALRSRPVFRPMT